MSPKPTQRKITILTYGTRGDVQPFVALGVGLQSAGHVVRLAAPTPFAPLAESRGIPFQPLGEGADQLARALADRAGLSWARMIGEMARHVVPRAAAVFRAAARAASDADLIIHSFLMTDAGHTLARSRGVPDISAQFFPMFLPTAAFPAVALPDLPLGDAYRRATHAVNSAVFRYGSRLLYRRIRPSAPDLPDLAPWPFAGPRAERTPILLAYSRHVLPRPPEWPSHAHVTGYWQLPPAPGWEPPQELLGFLASGPPPVYFAPGSMRTADLPGLLGDVVAAVRACAQRLILGISPDVAGRAAVGKDVLAVADVPHAWLFPQMRYILHHGGAGTTGAAAAAGVPTTAIPFSVDQTFWARQIQRRGLGPAGPPARRLTRRRLQSVLRSALSNPVYEHRAAALGEKIRQEHGVTRALHVIDARLMGQDDQN